MERKVVLIRTDLTDEQLSYIKEHLNDKFYLIQSIKNEDEISQELYQKVNILIVHSLTQSEVERYPNLCFVQVYGRGTDKICTKILKEKKIKYCCTENNMLSESIAEYVLLQILYWERNFSLLNTKAHTGKWNWKWRSNFQYRTLNQLIVGIVGKGNAGCAVAELLFKLGVETYFINIGERMQREDTELIHRMDYITLHLPLNSSTEKVIDLSFFRKMKCEAVFINTSRGKIVREDHLALALQQGIIRAASLDVTKDEPIAVENILSGLQNLVITPHIAGRTKSALQEHVKEITNNINEEVWRWNL